MEYRNVDYNLSPYTGLTRDSWIEVGKNLLSGVFGNVNSIADPIVVQRNETEITYPHKNASPEKKKIQLCAERFEGLARSFFIAAPVIHNDCETEMKGINIKDYYKTHILRGCTKTDELYFLDFEYLEKSKTCPAPFAKFQQTVECAALAIGLWMTKSEIWDTYTKEEQDIIAEYLKSYAYGNTHNDNWHMFNALVLAFLHICGYEIDESRMLSHVYNSLKCYAGDGWYRDGQTFDYYSCWAFNLYAPMWNVWYGYENAPELAAKIEENSNKLMETVDRMFDENGHTTMWGRSIIYRFASTSVFVGNAFLKNSKADFGLARRIMSGSLRQFMDRDDYLKNGVPTLGFYGEFSHLLQGYSCAASPLWCGKAFIGLYFPQEHPLWSEIENNGIWEENDGIRETVLDAPGICITNHGANGETVLRTSKVTKNKDFVSEMWNYEKLAYNSKFPWEATPSTRDDAESQQYVIRDMPENKIHRGNVTYWAGERHGVLYRKQYFGYYAEEDVQRTHGIYLADFPVERGIIRVDKIDPYRWAFDITLGSYGMPDNGCETEIRESGNAKAIIIKGKDHMGKEKQMAMTVYDGWDGLEVVESVGSNPDSEKSKVIIASTKRETVHSGRDKYILISQVITKESHENFREEELFPIESVTYSDKYDTGLFGDVRILLKNGTQKVVNFEGIDGCLSL